MTHKFPTQHQIGDIVGNAKITSIEEVKHPSRRGLSLRLYKIRLNNDTHFFELETTGERHAESSTRD